MLLVFAVVVGAGPLSSATPETLSLPLAFAAGAVLAALADTIMPEAYQQGRPTVVTEHRGRLRALLRPLDPVRPTH